MTSPAHRPSSVPPIFLRPASEGTRRDAKACPSWSAHRFRLDVFGASLLSRRAAFEMNRSALVLWLILIFEVVLWSAVFNSIFYAEVHGFGGWTVVAVALGLVYGTIILSFDQSFLVMDTKDPRSAWDRMPLWKGAWRWLRRIGFPIVVRVLAILLSAVAAGGVLDLIFFAQPIDRRIEEENLRWYLVALSPELYGREMALEEHDRDRASAQNDGQRRKNAEGSLSVMNKELNRALGEKASAESLLKSLRGQSSRLDTDLQRIKRGRPSGYFSDPDAEARALESYRRRLEPVQERLDEIGERISEQTARQRAAEAIMQSARQQIEAASSIISTVEERTQQRLQRRDEEDFKFRSEKRGQREAIQSWVDRYRIVANKEALLEDSAISELLGDDGRPPEPDVFDRYRILFDLKAGRPPVWPSASDQNRSRLQSEFHLEDAPACTDGPADSAPRHCRSATAYSWAYWILFAIAALVPSMALFTKLLSSDELKHYYSRMYQAAAGNFDALDHLAVDQQRGMFSDSSVEISHEY